ncbi:MAG: hypothetical protein HQL73_03670 [Magnetococcales bacterium]|nr:hypothetical protein [Magnetococcales bacterium]
MLQQVIMKSLYAYFLLAVISLFVAVVIKVIVVFFNRAAEKNVPRDIETSPAGPYSLPTMTYGVPAHHVAAIVAAVHYVTSGRIVRIDGGDDHNWTSIGRSQHLSSHDTRR